MNYRLRWKDQWSQKEINKSWGESSSESREGVISCAALVGSDAETSVSAAPVHQLADEQDIGVADTKFETALSGTRT